MKSITEAKTLEEGLCLGTPFVVRGLNLPCNLDACVTRAHIKDMDLFGYSEEGAEVWIKASEAFAQFRQESLNINIVDAPFPVLLDDELPMTLLRAVKKSQKKICLTLTRKGSYTPLHVDPDHGGGWMYLQQGIKKWQVMTVQADHFNPNQEGNLQDPPFDLDTEFVQESVIHAGDFLYFPALAPHRVWTNSNSFGVSGYAQPEFLTG